MWQANSTRAASAQVYSYNRPNPRNISFATEVHAVDGSFASQGGGRFVYETFFLSPVRQISFRIVGISIYFRTGLQYRYSKSNKCGSIRIWQSNASGPFADRRMLKPSTLGCGVKKSQSRAFLILTWKSSSSTYICVTCCSVLERIWDVGSHDQFL